MTLASAVPVFAAGVCVPVEAYMQAVKTPPDGEGCHVQDNGSMLMKICPGVPNVNRRIEVRAGKGPSQSINATHVLTWASTLERSAPAGVQFSYSGLVLLGADASLSVRYKDYVRGDSAVSGGSVAPADSVEIAKVDKLAFGCTSVASMDDDAMEAAVAALHMTKQGG
jgi:hypothetical protein